MNDSFGDLPCLYYHPTGVFFKYVFPKNSRAIRLTYIIMSINWDSLFAVKDVVYTGYLKSVWWPYHNIKSFECYTYTMKNIWKLYQMNGSKKTFLSYFKQDEFSSKKHFISFKITGDPYYYNTKNNNFHK